MYWTKSGVLATEGTNLAADEIPAGRFPHTGPPASVSVESLGFKSPPPPSTWRGAGPRRCVKTKMLVVVAADDHMVNPGPALVFAKMTHSQTLVLPAGCGHVAFVCQKDLLYRCIRRFSGFWTSN